MMRLTIGIPTWNRAEILRRTLTRLEELSIPRGVEWEVVVVDNNSSDSTEQVLSDFGLRLPLVPQFEARQGRSWALNLAMEAATGDYILWIDDDILVHKEWLAQYTGAFRRHPEAVVFGGRIQPRFEGSPPSWIRQAIGELSGVYGVCDPAEGPIVESGPFLPFGGNMAVRTDVQRRFPYDVRLGRRGGLLLAGEESSVVRKILKAELKGRWVPSATVEHIIPPRMQTLAYVRRYFHDFGVSMAGEGGDEPTEERHLFGRPLWVWRQAFESEIRYRIGRWRGEPPAVWARHLRLASFARGALRRKPMRVSRTE